MTRPRVLELFCGGGGASEGWHRAGFDVVGVDKENHPAYPFEFILADALDVLADVAFLRTFDLLYGGPPCQELTRARHLREAQGRALRADGLNLIPPTRAGFVAAGRPWVIENVEDAAPHLNAPIMLCGSMFGLPVRRHRLFESPMFASDPWSFGTPACRHVWPGGRPVGLYGRLADEIPGGGHTAKTIEEAREAMGITWMGWRSRTQEWDDLKEAIPPAYTEWIGQRVAARLG